MDVFIFFKTHVRFLFCMHVFLNCTRFIIKQAHEIQMRVQLKNVHSFNTTCT